MTLLLLFKSGSGGGGGGPVSAAPFYRGTVNMGHGISPTTGATLVAFVSGVGRETTQQ